MTRPITFKVNDLDYPGKVIRVSLLSRFHIPLKINGAGAQYSQARGKYMIERLSL